MSQWGNFSRFLSNFQSPPPPSPQQQQQPQPPNNEQEEVDGGRAVSAFTEQTLLTLKAFLVRHAEADLEAVRQAKAAHRYQEPFAALPGLKLFAQPHFALFRPLFHDFLQLRLSLAAFEAQQRTIGREMGAVERARRRREAKLMRMMTGKRRLKLKGARRGRGGGRSGRARAGTSPAPNSSTTPTTSPAQAQGGPVSPQPSPSPSPSSAASKKPLKPITLTEAQMSKLETDFAVRINSLTARLNAIPARPQVPVGPYFGGGGRQLPPTALGDGFYSTEAPLSELLVKLRAWLLKECAHLSAKVGRIVEEGRKGRAEREQQRQGQQQQANSASLSATPQTPGSSSGGQRSAIGSASTSASPR